MPGPSAPPPGEGVRSARGNLTATIRAVARRDVLGVNATVLAVIMLPLLFGFYAKVHWGYLFPPDSRYYITMTLRDMGRSDATALTQQVHLTGIDAESWYFAHSDPVWLLVQPRMLYPFLSVPFVWLFGLRTGMIVVPMIALATAVFASTRLVQRLYGPFAALAAGGLLAAGGAMVGLAEAITDPLAITIIALMLLNLPIGRRSQGHNLVFLALLSVLMCLTRQVMPMVVGMAAAGWLWAAVFPGAGRPRRVRNEWLAPAGILVGIALAGQVVGTILAPYDVTQQFLYASNEPTLGHAIKDLPHLAWKMTHAEALGMVQNDRYLLVLMAAPFIYLLVRFTDVIVGLFLGGLAGTYALIIANGVPSGMRYESVLFPIAALALGAMVHRFAPEALRGGSVGTGVLPSSGLENEASWWQGGGRRVPGLAAASALALVVVIGWSATHGSASMVGQVPTAPAAAAALAGTGHEVIPGGSDPASQTIKYGLLEAEKLVAGHDNTLLAFTDWRHPLRYKPMGPADPGWKDRGSDGTAVIRYGDFAATQMQRFAGAITFQGAVDPDTLKILTLQAGTFGQDVTFQISDRSGRVHTGHATVLYPVRAHEPGIFTELVYES